MTSAFSRLAGLLVSAGVGGTAVGVAIAGMPNVALGTPLVPALALEFGCSDLARPFLLALGLITIGVASWTLRRGAARDGARLAVFAAFMVAVLLARSVAAFLLAWELMALASLVLVATYHRLPSVRRALLSYGSVSQLGTVAIAIALVLLGTHARSFRFEDLASAAAALPSSTRGVVAALALVGFGSKAGLVPLHFWLPRAHPVAPAGASAMLSGAMLNVAVYGFVLVTAALAAPVSPAIGLATVAAGAISALTGALLAALETDIKRLLAYSSIENVGIVFTAIGIFLIARSAALPAVASLAIAAAIFHAMNHGFFKSALFLSAGTVAQNAGSTDLERLGALWRLMPLTTVGVLVASAAAAALPPSNAFASEWLVFRALASAIQSHAPLLASSALVALAAIALAGGLAAIAAVKLFATGFLGANRSTHPANAERFDVAAFAVLALGAVVLLCGIAPAVVLTPLAPLAAALSGATTPPDLGTLPVLPALIAILPIAGALASIAYARVRRVRAVETWNCGSAAMPRGGYTATALSNPIRRIAGAPIATTLERDLVRIAAFVVQRFARRLRVVQGGLLRVYLVYAAAAVIVILVIAR